MQVKEKFVCNSVVDTKYNNGFEQRHVHFNATYSKEGENADYSKATPSGTLTMQIDKDTPAYDHFQPGKSYYLTFDEAPAQ